MKINSKIKAFREKYNTKINILIKNIQQPLITNNNNHNNKIKNKANKINSKKRFKTINPKEVLLIEKLFIYLIKLN